MEHFSEQTWADFTRGFPLSGKARDIHAHLATGCLHCKTAKAFWSRLQTLALSENAYAPPFNLVRQVKLEFAAGGNEAEKWTAAKKIFDTFSQPLLAGVRSAASTPRQVVYEAEGLIVDLRFDRMQPSGTVSATGQMLDQRVPRGLLAGSPVVVWTQDGKLVATTEANGFGEFQLEFVPQDHVRLTARVGRRRVHIPLSNLK